MHNNLKPSNAIATVKFMLLTGVIALFASCTPEESKNTSDTVQKDSTVTTKAMTVTTPVSPVPKQAADSIWEGDYIEKYPNGVIKKRGYIRGGLASGEWLTFYDDGKPWSKGMYHAGVRTGYGVSWYHDGQKSSEGYYNNGKAVGVWSYWSESTHELIVKNYGGEMPDSTKTK